MQRLLPPGRYALDSVEPGDHLLTDWAEVTAEAIDTFAALTGDRFEIHLSNEAALRHGFPARVAHGLLVLSLIEGLKSSAPAQFETFAALGYDWSFRTAVFAGDRIRARVEVRAKRIASVEKGLLIVAIAVENQRGEIVQRGTAKFMAYRLGHFTR